MGLFDKLFYKKGVEKTPEKDSCINIERNDGTILRSRPIIDNEGNQVHKVIQDEHGRVIANIPHYLAYEQQEKGKKCYSFISISPNTFFIGAVA